LKAGHYSPLIRTDEQRVMQVLLGLQSNALKFTTEGRVTIFVEMKRVGEDFFLVVSVKDTGIGIKEED
jgi:signal transduction histidine kinase